MMSHYQLLKGNTEMILTRMTLITGLTLLLSGCPGKSMESAVEKEPAIADNAVVCTEPRPQICTREYNPVCATRDNGVRCVTTPCDSTEQVTYATGCTACADPRVISYVPGACL